MFIFIKRKKKKNQVIQVQIIEKGINRKQKNVKIKTEKQINKSRVGSLKSVVK